MINCLDRYLQIVNTAASIGGGWDLSKSAVVFDLHNTFIEIILARGYDLTLNLRLVYVKGI